MGWRAFTGEGTKTVIPAVAMAKISLRLGARSGSRDGRSTSFEAYV
jgi:hypothetical protein